MMGERSSIMHNALAKLTAAKRQVLLVLDTVEVVEAQGQAAVEAVTSWAHSLVIPWPLQIYEF